MSHKIQWQRFSSTLHIGYVDGRKFFALALANGTWSIEDADCNELLVASDLATAQAQLLEWLKPTAIPMLITDITAAYLVAVPASELDERIQLEADREAAQQEIIEVTEARPYAPANRGQLNAITTWLARYAPHAEKNWLPRFTRTLFGRSIELSRLTATQASQLEIALAQLNRTRAYAADWNTADGELNMHYKFDLYPTDYERAKVSYRECQQRFCYQVSMGRVNHPKYLTRHEAQAFSALVATATQPAATH